MLNGARGRMGRAIASIADEKDCRIVAGVDLGDDPAAVIDDCDVVIDFSLQEATLPVAKLTAERGKPIVIGTTGQSAEDREAITALSSRIPMVWAGNFSTGVNLLFYLTQKAAEVLDAESDFDPEVIEMHHRHKKDAPSGTAERLLEILKESRSLGDADVAHGRQGITGERPTTQIGSHALRGGDVVGDHLVMFAGIGERLELTHRATDRVIFAAGALRAAKWAVSQPAGLYSMQDVLGLTA
jgi:4-hydroxy-tetrahydrodipicolinate reductase